MGLTTLLVEEVKARDMFDLRAISFIRPVLVSSGKVLNTGKRVEAMRRATPQLRYLEKIMPSSPSLLDEANAGSVAAPCSNRLPIWSDTAECESVLARQA
jgi:hypothetical protein